MVNTFWRAKRAQLYVDVDREKAKSLGVPLDDIFSTLAATLGSYYVNDFNKYGPHLAGACVRGTPDPARAGPGTWARCT
jgi:multidrug efflux pump subunit AcrB